MKNNTPTASIVIVSFNSRKDLPETYAALAAQTRRDFEVLLVDNASRDGSAEVAPPPGLEVRLVRNSTNRGFGPANNQGFRRCRAKWLLVLNPDAIPAPEWLAAMLEAGESSAEVGMVASRTLSYENPELIDNLGHLLAADGLNQGAAHGERDRPAMSGAVDAFFPSGCAAAYRRDVIERTGGFDEDFFLYGDDTDLGIHAQLLGYGAKLAPRAVVHHRRSPSLGAYSIEKLYWVERARLLIMAKYFPPRFWPRAMGFAGARYAATALSGILGRGGGAEALRRHSARDLAWAIMRAHLDALPLMPEMRRKGQMIMREIPDAQDKLEQLRVKYSLPFRSAILLKTY